MRRWKEGVTFGAVILVALGACVVWSAVMLSPNYMPADKQQATTLITQLLMASLGLLVGKYYKGNR